MSCAIEAWSPCKSPVNGVESASGRLMWPGEPSAIRSSAILSKLIRFTKQYSCEFDVKKVEMDDIIVDKCSRKMFASFLNAQSESTDVCMRTAISWDPCGSGDEIE